MSSLRTHHFSLLISRAGRSGNQQEQRPRDQRLWLSRTVRLRLVRGWLPRRSRLKGGKGREEVPLTEGTCSDQLRRGLGNRQREVWFGRRVCWAFAGKRNDRTKVSHPAAATDSSGLVSFPQPQGPLTFDLFLFSAC